MDPLAISGRDLGPRLAKALGLDGRRVTEIRLVVRMDEVVTVAFKEVVTNGTTRIAQYVSPAQADMVVSEMTSFTSQGHREFTTLGVKEESGFLAADGPAERLARAVLAGDVTAALVLADHVQEEWSKCRS